VLAWLAVRSARDQQVILEHQQAIISQDVTDALAKKVRDQLDDTRSAFVQRTRSNFSKRVLRRLRWPGISIGNCVTVGISPKWALPSVSMGLSTSGRARTPWLEPFRSENDPFEQPRKRACLCPKFPQTFSLI
jgi:hypothetical protein